MWKGLRLGIGILSVVAVLVVGLYYVYTMPNSPLREHPNFSIISKNAEWINYGGWLSPDYKITVSATIYNDGGKGMAVIWVEVEQDDETWTKTEQVILSRGESEELVFIFAEPDYYGVEATYEVRIDLVEW